MKLDVIGGFLGKWLGQAIAFAIVSMATTYVGLYLLNKLGILANYTYF
jgi:hypothetical protein